MASAKIEIFRKPTYRFYGVGRAAKKLGVSVTAVHNVLTGRVPNALSKDKRAKIKIVDIH